MLDPYDPYDGLDDVDEWLKSFGAFGQMAMPLIARALPNLIADDLVGVQPMTTPSASVYYMKYKYGKRKTVAEKRQDKLDAYVRAAQPVYKHPAHPSAVHGCVEIPRELWKYIPSKWKGGKGSMRGKDEPMPRARKGDRLVHYDDILIMSGSRGFVLLDKDDNKRWSYVYAVS